MQNTDSEGVVLGNDDFKRLPRQKEDNSYIIYDLSTISDYSVAQKIEQSSNLNFKDWLAMAKLPWVEKEPIIAIAKKLAKLARTSTEIRKTFLLPKLWSDYGQEDYSLEIKKEMEKQNKVSHETCVEVLRHYETHKKEDENVCPTLKIVIMKKALITSKSPETFLNSRIVRNWKYATELSLREINWPIEKWRLIVDSHIPTEFKIIAQQKIITIRKAGSNQQLISQA